MQVFIKIVPDDRPNDDGEWVIVNPSVISIADWSNSRSAAEKIMRQCAPAGFHIVGYELRHDAGTR
jgi:hypothetical protein